tara:strand:- start:403 stop:930 length:528 start_codon:yes stop_codon:yes gene_type:complete
MKDNKQQLYTDSFMEYYEKYSDDIFRFCMVKVRNRDVALDITQDTFMKFWEYIIKDTVIENERPLLYRIANNYVIDRYRKKKDVLVENFTDPDYHQLFEHDEVSRAINKIDGKQALLLLDELPETMREIINLRFVHDFSISEIADVLDIEANTASVNLHRGLKKLRELIASYEQR